MQQQMFTWDKEEHNVRVITSAEHGGQGWELDER